MVSGLSNCVPKEQSAVVLSELFQAIRRRERSILGVLEIVIGDDVHGYFHIRGTNSILHIQGYPDFCDAERMAISVSVLDAKKFDKLKANPNFPPGNEHTAVTRWIYRDIRIVDMVEGEIEVGSMLHRELPPPVPIRT